MSKGAKFLSARPSEHRLGSRFFFCPSRRIFLGILSAWKDTCSVKDTPSFWLFESNSQAAKWKLAAQGIRKCVEERTWGCSGRPPPNHMAVVVKTNGIPFWRGCTTHFRTYFGGDWDGHWGYDLAFDPWPHTHLFLRASC